MSVLQEYQEIRKNLGEETFKQIETYLAFHPEVILSDVYYKREEWNKFTDWWNETPDVVKKNEPIVFVIEDYKGLAEHNFIGTKNEIMKILSLSEKELDKAIETGDFHFRCDISYLVSICESPEDLVKFLFGEYNDDKEDMIHRNYSDLDVYDGCYDDWYWNNDLDRCGEHAIAIAKEYAINCKNPKHLETILQALDLIEVKRHRFSVTQGMAEVLVEGKCVVNYGDDICLKRKDGTFSNGHRNMRPEEVECFVNEISGWGSITKDETFIKAAIKQYPDKIKEKLESSLPLSHKIKNYENQREEGASTKKTIEKEL